MGARFYDEAIANKINNWLKVPNLKVLKPNEVSRFFEMTLDEGKDRITLPQFVLSRSGYEILNTNKQPKSFDGVTIRIYDKDGKLVNNGSAMKLNAVPIHLEYQLDIYTADMDDCDDYVRNFVFNFINYPTSSIEIPYNDLKITHKFSLNLNKVVEDNSDIPQRLFPSQFVRYTLTFVVDDAYLFSIPTKKNVMIAGVQLAVKDDDEKKIVEIQDYEFKEENNN